METTRILDRFEDIIVIIRSLINRRDSSRHLIMIGCIHHIWLLERSRALALESIEAHIVLRHHHIRIGIHSHSIVAIHVILIIHWIL